jgi:hypothetical protein
MATAVLKLRITGASGAYRVLAEFEGAEASEDLGKLPDTLKDDLPRLQEAMLLT